MADDAVAPWALYGFLGVYVVVSLFVLYRIAHVGVSADDHALVIRNIWTTKRRPWNAVGDVGVDAHGVHVGGVRVIATRPQWMSEADRAAAADAIRAEITRRTTKSGGGAAQTTT